MTDNMKKIFLLALSAVLSLVACTDVESDMIPVNTESNSSFTITAQTETSATRAGISGSDATGYDVVWENGDKIFVYTPPVAGYASGEISIKSGFGTTSAVFDVDKPVNVGDPIWSPAALGGSLDNGEGLSWPGQQVYSSTNGVSGIPMFGTAMQPVDDEQNIQFSNLGGMLKITLFGNGRLIVKSISIKSAVTPVSGSIAVDDSGDKPVAVIKNNDSEAAKTINLEVPDVPLSEEGTPFFINMVPGGYEGIEIYVTFSSNEVMTKRLKEGKVLNIERSRITPIQFTLENFSVKAIMPEIEDPDFDQVWEEGDDFFAYVDTPVAGGSPRRAGKISVDYGWGTHTGESVSLYPLDPDVQIWSPSELGTDPSLLKWPSRQYYSGVKGVKRIPLYCTSKMEAGNESTLVFSNLGGLLHLNLKGDSQLVLKQIIVRCSGRPISGGITITDAGGIPVVQPKSTGARDYIELNVPDIELNNEGKDFYINMMAGHYGTLDLIFIFSDVLDMQLTVSGDNATIERGKITDVSLELDEPTEKMILPGEFTVSSSGKKARFARGNLSCVADYSEYKKNASDDFYINGTQYEQARLFFFPARYFESTTAYYGKMFNDHFKDDDKSGHNDAMQTILNDSHLDSDWKLLSKDEWEYIINNRPGHDQKRSYGIVNGNKGYILLPDAFTFPLGLDYFTPRISHADMANNTYDGTEWKLMELAGAVFLRMDGHYNGEAFIEDNERLVQWSSGYMSRSTEVNGKGDTWFYGVEFPSEGNVEVPRIYMHIGYSMRLVKYVQ